MYLCPQLAQLQSHILQHCCGGSTACAACPSFSAATTASARLLLLRHQSPAVALFLIGHVLTRLG
jgi:hypothetical protein